MISNCKLFINFPKLFRDLLLYVYNDWMLSSLLLLLNGGRHFKALISHSTKLWHKVCFSLLKSQKIVKFWYNKHFHFIAEVLANWTIFLKRISVLGSLLLKQHVLDFLGAIMRCIFFRSFNHQVQDTHKKTYFIEIPTFDFNLDKKYTRSSFSNNPNPHGRGGGVFLTRSTMDPFSISTEQGLGSPKFMTLFLLVLPTTQKSYFWHFSKNFEIFDVKILKGVFEH